MQAVQLDTGGLKTIREAEDGPEISRVKPQRVPVIAGIQAVLEKTDGAFLLPSKRFKAVALDAGRLWKAAQTGRCLELAGLDREGIEAAGQAGRSLEAVPGSDGSLEAISLNGADDSGGRRGGQAGARTRDGVCNRRRWSRHPDELWGCLFFRVPTGGRCRYLLRRPLFSSRRAKATSSTEKGEAGGRAAGRMGEQPAASDLLLTEADQLTRRKEVEEEGKKAAATGGLRARPL